MVKKQRVPWTKEHVKILKARFPTETDLKKLGKDLGGRSEGAIRQYAFFIKLRRKRTAVKKAKAAARKAA